MENEPSGMPSGKRKKSRDLPPPNSDEFAYLVAGYAWRDGLTANSIARELGLETDSKHLMQVKRALKRAHGRFLKLLPLPNEQLQLELAARFNQGERRPIKFDVVEDRWGLTSGPVYAKAAEVILELIADAVRQPPEAPATDAPSAGKKSQRPVIVCNAGGKTVSETVKAMVRRPPVLDVSDEEAERLRERLRFVAASAAYRPDEFQCSANFLSVTMAELYGAQHLALPIVEDEGLAQEHCRLVEGASLFVCGAGTREQGLMAWYFRKKGWEIPVSAVGDLAFNWLDADGGVVAPGLKDAMDYMKDLNPSLDLTRLMHIAANHRVLLILDSDSPEEKAAIGAAILKREYATDVVLGAKLARAILAKWQS